MSFTDDIRPMQTMRRPAYVQWVLQGFPTAQSMFDFDARYDAKPSNWPNVQPRGETDGFVAKYVDRVTGFRLAFGLDGMPFAQKTVQLGLAMAHKVLTEGNLHLHTERQMFCREGTANEATWHLHGMSSQQGDDYRQRAVELFCLQAKEIPFDDMGRSSLLTAARLCLAAGEVERTLQALKLTKKYKGISDSVRLFKQICERVQGGAALPLRDPVLLRDWMAVYEEARHPKGRYGAKPMSALSTPYFDDNHIFDGTMMRLELSLIHWRYFCSAGELSWWDAIDEWGY